MNQNVRTVCTFTVLLWAVMTVSGQQNGQQFVKLFSTTNCAGNPHTTILNQISNYTANASTVYYMVDGLWELHNATPQNGRQILTGTNSSCLSISTIAGRSLVFIRLGNEFQNVPVIHLFPQANYLGTPEVLRGTANLTRVFNYGSYVFTGTNSWALYNETGLRGNLTCRNPTPSVVARGLGITTFPNHPVAVGTVQINCPGTTTTTTTTKPGGSANLSASVLALFMTMIVIPMQSILRF